jgi:hypothetical protein
MHLARYHNETLLKGHCLADCEARSLTQAHLRPGANMSDQMVVAVPRPSSSSMLCRVRMLIAKIHKRCSQAPRQKRWAIRIVVTHFRAIDKSPACKIATACQHSNLQTNTPTFLHSYIPTFLHSYLFTLIVYMTIYPAIVPNTHTGTQVGKGETLQCLCTYA